MGVFTFIRDLVPTPAQWQALLDSKQDALGNPSPNNMLVGSGGAWSPQTYTNIMRLLNVGNFSMLPTLVDFNVGSADTQISIVLPAVVTRYRVFGLFVSGASHSLTTATCGLFTAAGGGGTAIVSDTALTVSSAAEATNNNLQSFSIANQDTQSFNLSTLFFRVGTPEGAAATASVSLAINPLS